MKKNIVLLVIMIGLLFLLTSCVIHPMRVDDGRWYFESVEINNNVYYPGDYTKENDEEYIYDYCLFKFNDDNTIVVSKYYNEEVVTYGTYEAKKEQIFVSLENGDEFVGTCNMYAFDGVWYEFILKGINFTLYLNEGGRGHCDYSDSTDEYYVNYRFDIIDDFATFFTLEEKYDEIKETLSNTKDNRINTNFVSFYEQIRDNEKEIIIPSNYSQRPKSITLHTSNQFNKPWVSYVCLDNNNNYLVLSIMYLEEDLSSLDQELSKLLSINKYVKKYYNNDFYTYFIYKLNNEQSILVRVSKTIENKDLDAHFLDNLEFSTYTLDQSINIDEISRDSSFTKEFYEIYNQSPDIFEKDGTYYRMIMKDLIYCFEDDYSINYYDYRTNKIIAIGRKYSNQIHYFEDGKTYKFYDYRDLAMYYTYLNSLK